MFIIITKVEVNDGQIDEVLELFKQKNPELVKLEQDWLKAAFVANRAEGYIMVLAYWNSNESYLRFSQSSKFKSTMMEFVKYFKGKPIVSINEVLFEM